MTDADKDDYPKNPNAECDLVMKGGVTSGVVYPRAILKLGGSYRFRSIGGASAGAIAAAFAAAAEYARANGDTEGFARLAKCGDALPTLLEKLFQPAPALKPLLKLLMMFSSKNSTLARICGVFAAFPVAIPVGAVVGGVAFFLFGGLIGAAVGGLLGAIVASVIQIIRKFMMDLEKNDFGFCRGLRMPGVTAPALTEWLHESLQYIAFGDIAHAPLTFGDLAGAGEGKHSITLRMVTTNLSMRRPHFLPSFGADIGYRPDEWKDYFPADVLAALAKQNPKWLHKVSPDTVEMPNPDEMPVIVAVRMSLSFPILLSALPVWMTDFAEAEMGREVGSANGRVSIKRGLLSDGGVSSNFPVHFFDQLLPTRPTFGLSLDPLPESMADAKTRAYLPDKPGEGQALPVWPIKGIFGFLTALLNAAKDWQDNLHATLPGYRERIARVVLLDSEGGLNLSMPPATVKKLISYGADAAEALLTFNMQEHQWRRSLSSYRALDVLGGHLADAWKILGPSLVAYIPHAQSYKAAISWATANLGPGYEKWAGVKPSLNPNPPYSSFPKPNVALRIQLDANDS